MEEKVLHDQVVEVLLVGMMALIKHDQVYLVDFDEPVHQEVVELLRHGNEDVSLLEFSPPRLIVVPGFLTFYPTVVSANDQVGVSIDGRGLLFYQVLSRHDEDCLSIPDHLASRGARLTNIFVPDGLLAKVLFGAFVIL